jgi:hypothetical protein
MAKTLLLNGCSYTHGWNPDQWFEGHSIVNLAMCGGSNRRAMRTTVEWISEHGNPDYVILPLTYPERRECIFSDSPDYVAVNIGYFKHTNATLEKSALTFWSYEDSFQAVDNLFTDIIMFSAFLSSRGIPHMMFDMCNNWEESLKNLDQTRLASKIQEIKNNPNIIDFFHFCGNLYLHKNNASFDSVTELKNNPHPQPRGIHYNKSDYHILEQYLDSFKNK